MKPDGIIEFDRQLSPETAEDLRRMYQAWSYPQVRVLPPGARYSQVELPNFGQLYMFGEPEPDGPFQRYRNDLYGRPRRDWLPLLSAGLLAALVALPFALVLFLAGIS